VRVRLIQSAIAKTVPRKSKSRSEKNGESKRASLITAFAFPMKIVFDLD